MSRQLTVVICVVVLLLALVSIWQRLKPASVAVDRAEMVRINTVFGEVLAEETIRVVNSPGKVVIVTMSDPAQRTDDRWNAFERALKKHPAFSLTTEVAQFQPEPGQRFLPGQTFLEILTRHPDAVVFVFLVDLPEWPMVSQAISENQKLKLVAVDALRPPTRLRYGGYFTSGILTALISFSTQPVTSPPKTSREWFAKYYQVYTPQDYELLP